jgi:hypothetical protein
VREPLPAALQVALEPALLPGESVARYVPAVGCTMVLTDRHLFVVREGSNYRPKSGIQRWHLDRELTVSLADFRRGAGRLVIERRGRTASVFLLAEHADAASALIADARRVIHSDGGRT